jgi:hypothetical protein
LLSEKQMPMATKMADFVFVRAMNVNGITTNLSDVGDKKSDIA